MSIGFFNQSMMPKASPPICRHPSSAFTDTTTIGRSLERESARSSWISVMPSLSGSARSSVVARIGTVGLREFLEDPRLEFLGDARTAIDHLDADMIAFLAAADCDLVARV